MHFVKRNQGKHCYPQRINMKNVCSRLKRVLDIYVMLYIILIDHSSLLYYWKKHTVERKFFFCIRNKLDSIWPHFVCHNNCMCNKICSLNVCMTSLKIGLSTVEYLSYFNYITGIK